MPLAEKTEGGAPYFAVVLVPARRPRRERTARGGRARPRRRRDSCTGEARGRARRGRGALRLRPLSRPRAGAARPGPPRLRQPRGARPRRRGARPRGRRAPASRWSRAAIPASSPWPRRCARRSTPGPPAWRAVDLAVIPGVTAMLAVAARVGAPLGHDFCAISLSDNLKPWALIERRLAAAAEAGFVIALYNPVSKARPTPARRRLRDARPAPPGDDAGGLRPRRRAATGESIAVVDLAQAADAAGRHGDADHRRLGGDPRRRASRPAAAGLHAAHRRSRRRDDRSRPSPRRPSRPLGASGSTRTPRSGPHRCRAPRAAAILP